MPLLSDLITLPAHPLISLVGAGGKTTTMYTLAQELAQQGKRVITTTTTNIYFPQQGETDTLIVSPETPRLLKMIRASWEQHQRITVAASPTGAGKLAGLQVDQPYELLMKSGADVVIVEADGARHHMIKAPAEHEPVVPPQTNVAFLMMSAGAINQPLSAEVAHRPEQVAKVASITMGDVLTPEIIARVMLSAQGGMKNIPHTALVYLLVTHAFEGQRDTIEQFIRLVRHLSGTTQVLYSARPGQWSAQGT
ncbi:MAG TPA: selenium cofactor biosynthesis protein YqeC [Ktedonobacteraceae bacterium]|nr:selenium cofactor biosynthesis protein YqeC [Ktedonobacteraceae bacterium]